MGRERARREKRVRMRMRREEVMVGLSAVVEGWGEGMKERNFDVRAKSSCMEEEGSMRKWKIGK